MAVNLDKTGINFESTYPIRSIITDKIKPREYVWATLQDLKKQGINYLEVQGNIPRGLSAKEFQKILQEFEQLENYQIRIGFLQNAKTGTLAGQQGNKALNSVKKTEFGQNGVIGLDFAGGEAEFNQKGMGYFQKIYREVAKKAEAANKNLVIRVHVGEGNPQSKIPEKAEVAENNVRLLVGAIEQLKNNNELSDKVVLRLGHATHAADQELQRISRLGIIIEANLTSNLRTGSVGSDAEKDQVLLRFLYHDVKLTINTDGGGIMTTTLPKEYEQARDILNQFKNNEIGVTIDGVTYYYDDLPQNKKKNFNPQRLTRDAWQYRNKIAPNIPTY